MTAFELKSYSLAELELISSNNLDNAINPFVEKIQEHKEYFQRTVSCFTEEDSNFQPADGLLSVAGQVLHVALSLEYFISGMFGPYEGFGPLSRLEKGFVDMSWAPLANEKDLGMALNAEVWADAFEASTSFTKALKLFDQAMDTATEMFASRSVQEIQAEQLPENPVLPVEFTYAHILELMNDHTAHHRGSLVVYGHLLGKDPQIPYFELTEAWLKAEELEAASL